MTRPTDALRAEIAQSVREMPDDILLALVAHHVQPRRGRRPKPYGADLEALAGLLASEKRRADQAAEEAQHYKTQLNETVSLGFKDRARAEAAENLAANWKTSQEQVSQLEAELASTRRDRDKGYSDLANARMVHELDQKAIDAVNDRVERGEAALAEMERVKASLAEVTTARDELAKRFLANADAVLAVGREAALTAHGREEWIRFWGRAWKACAREMRNRWLHARRLVRGVEKAGSRALPPTPFEAREREKIRTGFYERERPDPEAPADDLDEDTAHVPTPAEREPRLNGGGPLLGDKRRTRR